MRVRNTANARECPIKHEMRRHIRRRPPHSLHHATVEIDHHQILGGDRVILHAARLDHHSACIAIDATGVSERERREPAIGEGTVGGEHLLAKIREARLHAIPARCFARAMTCAITSRYFMNVSSTTCSVGIVVAPSPSVSLLKRPKPDSWTPLEPRPGAGLLRCEKLREYFDQRPSPT